MAVRPLSVPQMTAAEFAAALKVSFGTSGRGQKAAFGIGAPRAEH
jgi:hypothetical protein